MTASKETRNNAEIEKHSALKIQGRIFSAGPNQSATTEQHKTSPGNSSGGVADPGTRRDCAETPMSPP